LRRCVAAAGAAWRSAISVKVVRRRRPGSGSG
jgi:hypothetical protein